MCMFNVYCLYPKSDSVALATLNVNRNTKYLTKIILLIISIGYFNKLSYKI